MWKKSPESTSGQRSRHATPQSSAPSSGSDIGEAHRVRVRIIRPDGSYRDVTVAGHFREEHLCSLVDDELCHLGTGETLTLHLFHPDGNSDALAAEPLAGRVVGQSASVHARGAGARTTMLANSPRNSARSVSGWRRGKK